MKSQLSLKKVVVAAAMLLLVLAVAAALTLAFLPATNQTDGINGSGGTDFETGSDVETGTGGGDFEVEKPIVNAGSLAIVYLSGSGNDGNAGNTQGSPVATVGKALQLVEKGNSVIYITGTVPIAAGTVVDLDLATYGATKFLRHSSFKGTLFTVASGTVTLRNTTIDGGLVEHNSIDNTGTMISVTGGTLNLESGTKLQYNSKVSEDSNYGAAINISGAANVNIGEGVTIQGNSAKSGGGIWVNHDSAVVTITGATFSANTTAENDGGAILVSKGLVRMVSGTFQNNSAKRSGGAVMLTGTGTFKMEGGSFINNDTLSYNNNHGGALASDSGNAIIEITGGRFEGNVTDGSGGAIHITAIKTITIKDAVFDANGAGRNTSVNSGYEGGAIWQTAGNLAITDTTFTNNYAAVGGAIRYSNSTGTFTLNGTDFSKAVFRGNVLKNHSRAVQYYGIDVIYQASSATITGYRFENSAASRSYGGDNNNRNTDWQGSVVSQYNNALSTIENCQFIGNNAYKGFQLQDGHAAIKNCTFSGFRQDYGAAIYLRGDEVSTITDCTIGDAGLTGNYRNYIGINVTSSDKVTITNTTITNNTGEGIYSTGSNPQVTLVNSQITNNEKDGFYSTNSGVQVTLVDSQITNNKGIGVRLANTNSVLTLRGTETEIRDNTANTTEYSGNIRLYKIGTYIQVDGSLGDTQFDFSLTEALGKLSLPLLKIASNIDADNYGKFTFIPNLSDGQDGKLKVTVTNEEVDNYKVYTYQGYLKILLTNVYVSANGNDETGDGTSGLPLKTLTAALEYLKPGGTIYMLSHLTVDYEVSLENLTLKENYTITVTQGGHITVKNVTYSRSGSYINTTRLFYLNGGTLDISGSLRFDWPGYGENASFNGFIYVNAGVCNLYSGASFTTAASSSNGGSSSWIHVNNTGVLNVYEGAALPVIDKGTWKNGTELYSVIISGQGTMNMYGGSWKNNGSYGGTHKVYGVRVNTGATFNMSGGELSGAASSVQAIGVWVNGGTFNMLGGVIKDNRTSDAGPSGVRITGGVFNISGTAQVISGTQATEIPVGISGNSGTIHINGDLDASAKIELFPNVVDENGSVIVINDNNYNVSLDNFIKADGYNGTWQLDDAKSLRAAYEELADVYVSTSGNDQWSGARPFPVRTLTRAMELVKAGGTIYLINTYTLTTASETISKTVTYNNTTVTKEGVTIKAYSTFTANTEMINSDGKTLSIDGINLDGNNRGLDIYIGNNGNFTLKNATVTGFNRNQTFEWDNITWGYGLFRVRQNSNLTLDNVVMKGNNIRTLIGAANWNTITLHDVDMSDNAVIEDRSIFLAHWTGTTNACKFNIGGKVVMHEKGIEYDTVHTSATQGVITVDKTLSAGSKIVVKSIDPFANNRLVAETVGNGISTSGATFTMRTPAHTFAAFDGNGKLYAPMEAFMLDEVYLDVTNGKDQNSGATAALAVKTWARAQQLVKDGGTVYLVRTYTANGSIMDRENITGGDKSVTVQAASSFTGTALFDIPSGKFLMFQNISVVGGAYSINVQSGGTLRFREGTVLQAFTGATAVQSAGNTIIDRFDISEIGLSEGKAVLTVTGGELSINGGTYEDSAKNLFGIAVSGGEVNINGGNFNGFRKVISVSDGTVNVISGNYTNNGNGTNGGFATVTGGVFNQYGGTVTASNGVPVYVTNGTFNMQGGSIGIGDGTGSAILAETGANVAISNGTLSASKGFILTANGAITLTVSGAPALSGLFSLKSEVNAGDYTGGITLQIVRTDTISSKTTVVVNGNTDATKFSLVNENGTASGYSLRAKDNTLVAYSVWTVTFDLNGGLYNRATVVPAARHYFDGDAYNATAVLPSTVEMTRLGYTFGGWAIGSAGGTRITDTNKVSSSHKLVAVWTPRTDTQYTVEYYLQKEKADGYVRQEPEKLQGTTNATVTPPAGYATKYPGFAVNASHSGNVLSTEIAADGSTVLKVYYDRKTYKIIIDINDGKGSKQEISALYGATVVAPVLTREGYDFDGYYTDTGLTKPYTFSVMPAADTTIHVKWVPKTYILTFNLSGGSYAGSLTQNVTFDTEVTGLVTDGITKKGYEFQYWSIDGVRFDNGNSWIYPDNKVAVAVWKPSGKTAYYVDHYIEDVQSVFRLDYTESKFGTTDTVAVAEERIYNGFSIDETQENVKTGTITSSGELRLKLYYKRNTHNVTFETFGGGAVTPIAVKYGTKIAEPQTTLEKAGYTLSGWYTGATKDNVWNFNLDTMPDSDLVLRANWTANRYQVVYNGNGYDGGLDMSEQSFTYDGGAKSLIPNTFTRTGYRFSGWSRSATGDVEFTNGQTVSNLTTANGGSVTLYAVWDANQYTVVFNKNDVFATGEMSSIAFRYGTNQTLSENKFVKQGYTFLGWSLQSTGGVSYSDKDLVGNLTAVHNASVVLYAKWQANDSTKYKILIYQQNADDNKYTLVQTLEQTGSTDSEATYRNDSILGNKFSYNENLSVSSGIITADGKLELKLYYDRVKYNVSYNTNGGSTIDPIRMKHGATMQAPANPTRTGHVFLHWYIDASEPNVAYTFDKMPEKDIQLYALWQANVFHIAFNGNGATFGEMQNLSITYQTSGLTALSQNLYQRTGYAFKGWNTQANGDGTAYANAASIANNLLENDGEVLNLYAQWTIQSFSVTFDAKEGTPIPGKVTQEFGTKLTRPTDPERKGYSFDGWYTEEGNRWSFATDTVPGKDITLTARYSVTSYRIYWYLNGGASASALPETYTIESATIILPTAGLTKDGNEFTEWRINAIENGTKVEKIERGSVGDIYLYAVWTPKEYTMSFETYGGSSIASIVKTYATPISKPEDPVRAGYDFDGWYKSLPDTNGGYTLNPDWGNKWKFETDTVPMPGMTLHAKWNAKTYTITYELSDGAFSQGSNPYPTSYKITDNEINFNSEIVPTRVGYRFLGWNPDKIEQGSFGNKTVVAQWELMSYTVNFHTNGGSGISPLSVNYGALISEPAVPTRTGYRFVNWYKDAGLQQLWNFGTDKMPERGITLYAAWTKERFTISFDTNDGSLVPAMTVEFDATTTAPVAPNKLGYTFDGWYADEALTSSHTFGKMPAVNFTLYAKWRIETYSIKYVLGGGSFAAENPNPATYTVEDAFDIHGTLTGKPGYTFAGWSPATVEKGTVNELTVTALWEANQYVISFELAGGAGDVSPISVYYNQKIGALPAPVRSGYTFVGWFDGDKPYTRDSVWVETTAKTLTAKWEALDVEYTVEYYIENAEDGEYSPTADTVTLNGKTDTNVTAPAGYEGKYPNFTVNAALSTVSGVVKGDGSLVLKVYYTRNVFDITFNSDGGSSVAKVTGVKFGAKISAPNAPTKKGYRFVRWEKGGMEFTFTTMPGENLELKAKWEIETYDVKYHLNGGTVAGGTSLTKSYTVNDTVTLPTLTRENYVFDGWFDNAEYSGDKVDTIAVGSIGNREFFAKWTIGTATIGFDSNGGTAVNAISQIVGSLVTKPEDPTKEGYDFDGWYEDNGTFIMPYVFDTMPSDGIMLYAKWIAHTYTVSFDANTGSGAAIADLPMVYGNEKNLPRANYQKTGYTFAGWNTNREGNGTAFADGAAIVDLTAEKGGEVTLYAQWTANNYIVRFHKNAATATGAMQDFTATYDVGFALTENGYARVGYTFIGWNTAEGGSGGIHYDNNATVSNLTEEKDGTVNLYAQWQAVSYQLTFDANGGSAVAETKTVTFDAAVGALPVSTRDGYDFDNWTVDGKDLTAETVWSYASAKQAVAKWTAKKDTAYTVLYYGQNASDDSYSIIKEEPLFGETGAAVAVENYEGRFEGFVFKQEGSVLQGTIGGDGLTKLYVYYDRVVSKLSYVNVEGQTIVIKEGRFGSAVTAPVISKTGYTFHNFYDSVSHAVFNFANGMPAKNTVLELNLTPNAYTVKFDKNGETAVGATQDQAFVYDAAAKALNANGYQRTGYSFVGWNESPDGSGTSYRDKEAVQNITAEANKTVTLYAIWRANQYTLTLMDESNTISEKTVTYDEKIGTLPSASKTGYRFRTWSVGGLDITSETVWNFDESKIAEAQWTAQNYDITFDSAVSDYTNPNKMTFTFDEMSVSLTDASKTGYVFLGWYSDRDRTNKITSFATDEEGKTVYAKWSLNAPTAVEITTGTFTKVYEAGKTHALSASASHAATSGITYSYQWYKDGGLVNGATSATLNIGFVADSGTYTVRVIARDVAANLASEEVTSAEKAFTITKAGVAKAVLQSNSLVYNGSTQTANISTSELYVISGNTEIAAGDNYSATVSLKDKANYYWQGTSSSEDYTIRWKIERADYSMEGITFDGITVEYDGQAHRPEVKGTLPTGADNIKVTVEYDTFATNVSDGQVTVTATFTTNSPNYKVPQAMTATVEIIPKTIEIKWAEDNFTYSGEDQKGSVTAKYEDVKNQPIDLTLTLTENATFKDYKEDGYVFTAEFKYDESNYALPAVKTKTYHIKKATLTDDTQKVEKTYDGNAHGITFDFNGFKNNETLANVGTIQYSTDGTEWKTEVITVTNVLDSKTVYYKVTFTNYEEVSGSKEVKVAPKEMTVTVTATGGTYNKSPYGATEVHTDDIKEDNVTVTLHYTGRGATVYSSEDAPTNAGEYTATASISDSNYTLKGVTTADYVIEKATVDNPILNDNRVYTGEAQTINLPINDLYAIDCDAKTNAGEGYTAVVTLQDAANYKWATPSDGGESAPITYTWKIAKATLTDSTQDVEVTYDGVEHSLSIVLNGVAGEKYPVETNGIAELALKYKADNSTQYDFANPAFINKGTHTIYYTATSKNYEDFSGSKTLNIKAAPLTVTVSVAEVEYNGAQWAKEWTSVANTVDGISGLVNDELFSGTIRTSEKDVKTYAYSGKSTTGIDFLFEGISVKNSGSIEVSGNYEITYDLSVKIIPYEIAVNWNKDSFEYNGLSQRPTATFATSLFDGDEATIGYSDTSSNIDAKSGYTVTATSENNNYIITEATKTKEYSITAKEVTLEWNTETFTYNGTTQTPSLTGTAGAGANVYTYVGENGEVLTVTVSGGEINASVSYTATASLTSVANGRAKVENYTLVENTKEYSIGKKEITIEWAKDEFIYSGEDQKEKVTATYKNVQNQLIGLKLTKTENTFKDYKEGGYVFTAEFKYDESNYALPAVKTKTYNIRKATLTDSTQDVEVTYDGVAHGITVSATGFVNNENFLSLATVSYGLDNGYSNGTTPILQTDVTNGAVTVHYKAEFANYNDVIGSKTLNIKAAPLTVTVAGTEVEYNGAQWAKTWTSVANAADGISGLVNGELFSGTIRTSEKDVKTYAYSGKSTTGIDFLFEGISVDSATNEVSGNYEITYDLSVKIIPYEIAVNWNKDSFEYNGRSQRPTATFATSLFGVDEATIGYSDTSSNIDAKSGYTVTATSENNNYIITEATKTKEYSIKAKEVTLEWNNTETFTYNGMTQTPSLTGTAGDGDNVYTYVGENGEVLTVTVSGGEINASVSYTATASLTSVANGRAKVENYTLAENTKEYSIGKKEITYVWSYDPEYVYTGSPVGPIGSESVEGVEGELLQFTLSELETDAGTGYKRTATFVSVSGGQANKENYTVADLESKEYEVKNATLTGIVVQAYSEKYDGADHAAVVGTPTATAVNNQTVTWKYKTKEDGEYSEQVPLYKDAGTYTVYYQITAPNHDTVEGEFKVEIALADYNMEGITFDGITVEYDGQAHRPEVKGTLPTGADNIKVTVEYDTFATNVSAEAVTVTATFKTTSPNYNAPQAMTATVKITPKEVEIEWAVNDFTYSGLDQKGSVTATYEDVETALIDLNVTLEGAFKDYKVGGYVFTAEFKYDESNYALPAVKTKTYHIKKATLTDDTQKVEVTYDGNAHGITFDFKGFKNNETLANVGTIQYSTNGTNWKNEVITATNVSDSQTVYYKVTFTNYEEVSGSKEVNVTPKEMTVTVTATGGTYNKSPYGATEVHTDDIKEDNVTVTLHYTGRGATDYSSEEAPTNAGEYTATASISDSNYTLKGATTADYVIEKATVDNPVLTDNRVYTGEAQTINLPINDLYAINCDAKTNAGEGYPAVVTLEDAANYKWATPSDSGESAPITYTWKIAKANLEDTTVGYNAAYDGVAHGITVSATGFVNNENFLNLATVSYGLDDKYSNGTTPILQTDVTNEAVTVHYKAEFANYNDVIGSKTIIITPAKLSVEWTDPESLVYDGKQKEVGYRLTADTAASTDITVTVLYTGDKLTNGAAINAGDYKVKLSTENANFAFDIKTNIHTFTVTQRTLTIEGLVAEHRSYDGTVQIVMKGGKLVGIAEGDEERVSAVMPTSGTTEDSNVGNGKAVAFDTIVFTGEAKDNYALTQPTVSVNITPREVTVVWDNEDSYIYDGTDRSSGVTAKYVSVEGDVFSESINVTKNNEVSQFIHAGEYVFTANFADNANYSIVEGSKQKTLTIAPREIEIAANNAEKTYGEANPTLNWDYLEGSAQFVAGDNVVLQVTTNAEEFSAAGSGYYTRITPYANGDYNIAYTDGTFTIQQRAITVTVTPKESVYGQAPASLEATVTNGEIVNNDSVYDLKCEVTETSDVGRYAITGIVKNDNYTVTFKNENEAYEVKNATLTGIVVQAYSEKYDGADHAAVVGTPTATAVNNQTVTWKYKTKEDGEYSEQVPLYKDAGTYTVYYQITAPNHDTVEGEFKVEIALADYSMEGITFEYAEFEYDGEAHYPKLTETLPTGEDNIKVTVEYDTFATNVSDGEVTVTATFKTTSKNYNAPQAMTATVKITPKKVEIEWVVDDFTYNGKDQKESVTATYKDIKNQPIGLTLTITEATFKDHKVGGYVFTAKFKYDESNYALPIETTMTYHIKKAPLTITIGAPQALQYGEEFVAPVVESYEGFFGEDNESVLSGSLTITTDYTNRSNVGEYAITAEGFVCVNYVISYATSPLQVIPRTVNAIWTDYNFVYDGTDQKENVTASYLDVNGEAISLSVLGEVFKDYNVDGYLFTANFHALDEGSKNYRIDSETDTKRFMMQKRKVTVKANDATMYYSENPPTNIGWSYLDGAPDTEKFVDSDSVDFAVTTNATAESPVGNYVNTVTKNPNLSNYEVTYLDGVMKVMESLLEEKESVDLGFSKVENGVLVPTEHSSYDPQTTVYVTNIAEKQAASTLTEMFVNDKNSLKLYNLKGDEVQDETANVGTGWKIVLTGKDEEVVDSVTVVIKGDLSGDGKLNSLDKSVLHRLIAEMGDALVEAQTLAADINGDGKINSLDKAKLHRHIAELENLFEKKQTSVSPAPVAETEEPLFAEETIVDERLDEAAVVTETAEATAEEEAQTEAETKAEAETEAETKAEAETELAQEVGENAAKIVADVDFSAENAACGKSEAEITVLAVSEPKQSDNDFRITEIKKRRTSLSA